MRRSFGRDAVPGIWWVDVSGQRGFVIERRWLYGDCAGWHPGSDCADAVSADRVEFHAACWRICCRCADGGDRRIADFGSAGSAGDLCRAGAAEPWTLHSDGVCKTVRQERRGRDEVLPLRRNVCGVFAFRVQLFVWPFGIDESASFASGTLRATCGPGCSPALCSAGDDCGGARIQSGGGAVPPVGSRYLRRRSGASCRVYCFGIEGGELRTADRDQHGCLARV